MTRRVVITGMGVLTPIGLDLATFRQGLIEGRDGIAQVSRFEAHRHRCRLAGELKGFAPNGDLRPQDLPHLSRASQMIRVATAEALAESGLDLTVEDRSRIGVVLGTDLGGAPSSAADYRDLHRPYRKGRSTGDEPWRSLLLDTPIGSVVDQVAFHYGLGGFSLVMSTACSAGLHAIGVARDAIRFGQAEVMLTGGIDPLTELPQAGFGVLRSLASDRIRPFDRDRDGTLLGEAAAVLVLESEEHARARGASAWAEIAGYGGSTDGYHMTRPDETGDGPARAIRHALEDAGVQPEEVDYVKAHGTATAANDVTETRALKQIFGKGTQIPISSVKSMIGHTLGASGGVESVAAVLALAGGFVPPTLHLEHPDPECDLDYVPQASRPRDLHLVLANAFGFGGNNASLVFRRGEPGLEWRA
jgi:3-oxoacyl-[acyl-carrier-protein] synthase II